MCHPDSHEKTILINVLRQAGGNSYRQKTCHRRALRAKIGLAVQQLMRS